MVCYLPFWRSSSYGKGTLQIGTRGDNKMIKLNLWQIPRSDKRDRCGKCLLPFGKKKRTEKFKSIKYQGFRFPKVCYGCKLLLEKLTKN